MSPFLNVHYNVTANNELLFNHGISTGNSNMFVYSIPFSGADQNNKVINSNNGLSVYNHTSIIPCRGMGLSHSLVSEDRTITCSSSMLTMYDNRFNKIKEINLRTISGVPNVSSRTFSLIGFSDIYISVGSNYNSNNLVHLVPYDFDVSKIVSSSANANIIANYPNVYGTSFNKNHKKCLIKCNETSLVTTDNQFNLIANLTNIGVDSAQATDSIGRIFASNSSGIFRYDNFSGSNPFNKSYSNGTPKQLCVHPTNNQIFVNYTNKICVYDSATLNIVKTIQNISGQFEWNGNFFVDMTIDKKGNLYFMNNSNVLYKVKSTLDSAHLWKNQLSTKSQTTTFVVSKTPHISF